MAKYLRKFGSHSDYESFKQTEDFIRPNVSHCIQEGDVHYNPIPDPRLIAEYHGGPDYPTTLYYYHEYDSQYPDAPVVIGVDLIDRMWIDGVEVSVSTIDANEGAYTFSTEGTHAVTFLFKDPTTIPNNFFSFEIRSVKIPKTVTTIGEGAFSGNQLRGLVIPDSVTTIGDGAFSSCYYPGEVQIPRSITSIGNSAFCSNGFTVDEQTYQFVTNLNPNAIVDCRCEA